MSALQNDHGMRKTFEICFIAFVLLSLHLGIQMLHAFNGFFSVQSLQCNNK